MSDFVINDGVLEKYIGLDKSVVVPNGVVKIGASSFQDCIHLQSVEIAERDPVEPRQKRLF